MSLEANKHTKAHTTAQEKTILRRYDTIQVINPGGSRPSDRIRIRAEVAGKRFPLSSPGFGVSWDCVARSWIIVQDIEAPSLWVHFGPEQTSSNYGEADVVRGVVLICCATFSSVQSERVGGIHDGHCGPVHRLERGLGRDPKPRLDCSASKKTGVHDASAVVVAIAILDTEESSRRIGAEPPQIRSVTRDIAYEGNGVRGPVLAVQV